MPLQDLIAQADVPPSLPAKAGQTFERTDIDDSFVQLKDGLQTQIAGIWESLLGVSPIGAEDSFFDLGGHSLVAVRMFAALKRTFGVEFPISTLFEAPTVARIAAMIAAEKGEASDTTTAGEGHSGAVALRKDEAADAAPRHTHLVPLNHDSTKSAAPLFIVAGMFGNVLNLRHLAMSLSGERMVYGLQARGLIGDEPPHETIPDAAREYLAEVRQVQPEGPYLLAGYSGGGITAYEMAQQLRNAGEEVAVLAMLDTPLPVRAPLDAADKAMIKLQQIKDRGPRYVVDWFRDRRAWNAKVRQRAESEADTGQGAEFNNRKMEDAFIAATSRYEVHPWEGPLTLFRPPLEKTWKGTRGRWISLERAYVCEDNAWRQYAPHIEMIEVPGDHDSMVLRPNVTVLAQELAEVIANALSDESETGDIRFTVAE